MCFNFFHVCPERLEFYYRTEKAELDELFHCIISEQSKNERKQLVRLSIVNITPSDRGRILCIAFVFLL